MKSMFFLSLASGSSGNCYYLGTDKYGILFDAGIGVRAIKKILKANAIDLSQIMAVFVTHEHTDHIKSIGSLGEEYHIPIYATYLTHEGMEKSRFIEVQLSHSRRYIEKYKPTQIRDFTITPFGVPHDASDCVGFLIEFETHKWVLATDLGHINETVAQYLRMANHLVIEANYDREMLIQGNYPIFLKKRIMSGIGHLSNEETATFLASNYDLHLQNIWLCHLSKENNHPELASKTVSLALGQLGIRACKDVMVTTLKRETPSKLFTL